MSKVFRLFATALFALIAVQSVAAGADQGAAKLDSFLAQVHSLKANFTQTVLDAQLKTNKQSSGTVIIKRPNRFRWDYAAPQKQLIVADGKRVWMFDEDLEQVTVKTLDRTLASSPAMLLGGSDRIEQNFTVKDLGHTGKLWWVQLTPKVADTDFKKVRIGLDDKNVKVMELTDSLGQTTRIEFSDVQRNPEIPDSAFKFTPPPGADVIGDAGDKS